MTHGQQIQVNETANLSNLEVNDMVANFVDTLRLEQQQH